MCSNVRICHNRVLMSSPKDMLLNKSNKIFWHFFVVVMILYPKDLCGVKKRKKFKDIFFSGSQEDLLTNNSVYFFSFIMTTETSRIKSWHVVDVFVFSGPSGSGNWSPWCGEAAEQPGSAVSEPGEVPGGGAVLRARAAHLPEQTGPRRRQRGQDQEQPGKTITTSDYLIKQSERSRRNLPHWFFPSVSLSLLLRRRVTWNRANTDKLKLFTKKSWPERTKRSLDPWKVEKIGA